MAAGLVPWGVGTPLAERLPGTVVVPVTRSGPVPSVSCSTIPAARWSCRARSPPAGLAGRRGRAVRAVRPEVVVVDHELPAGPDVLGEHYVLAFGAARVTADTVVDVMAGTSAPRPAGVVRSDPADQLIPCRLLCCRQAQLKPGELVGG